MSPEQRHPRRHRLLRRLLAAAGCAALALSCVTALATPTASAATAKRLAVADGRTVSGPSFGLVDGGNVRTAFTIPKKRAGTVAVGLDLRRQSDGDRYRVRVTVTRSGTARVAVLRQKGNRIQVMSERRLPKKIKGRKTVWVEGSVNGSGTVAIRARAWVKGKSRPGWQRLVVDRSSQRVVGSGATAPVLSLAATKGSKKVAVTYTSVTVQRLGSPKPSAATTGVPAGTKLKVHRGNIVVTKAGTRLDRMDIHGFVTVKAPNVVISRSIVRGGSGPKTAQGVITNYGYKNLLITDTDVRIAHPSVYLDGIKGWGFTARRVHVVGGVDSIKIHGDDVVIADSLLENTTWYANDPYQNGGPTHNDNVQILKGKNLTITGNTIRGAQNFAVLGAANLGHVPNLVVRGNWLDGGHCTLKLQTMRGQNLTATVTGNKFGPNRVVSYCPIQALPEVKLTARDNVSEQTGKPVQIWRRP